MHPKPHAGSNPAVGATIAERLANWRAMSWEELVDYMTPLDGELLSHAETLTAPLVAARLRREG
jgi:hypothetical protein